MQNEHINQFNKLFKVGDPLDYLVNGEKVRAFLRWHAEKLPDTGRAVIWITGSINAIDINDVILETIKLPTA